MMRSCASHGENNSNTKEHNDRRMRVSYLNADPETDLPNPNRIIFIQNLSRSSPIMSHLPRRMDEPVPAVEVKV